jgi:AcrR family transcriptional regulator
VGREFLQAQAMPVSRDSRRAVVVLVAASRLARVPFAAVTFEDIAAESGLPQDYVQALFDDMHDVGAAILDHERTSMRAVQERVARDASDALEQLVLAFRLVGENLASDAVVRAGVRLAAESREHFPERRLDPFRTWEAFVTAQLTRARDAGLLKESVDIANTVWIVVAAGIGTKDLVAFQDAWDQAPVRLEAVVRNIVSLVRTSAGDAIGAGARER